MKNDHKKLLQDAYEYAIEYLSNLADRRVYPDDKMLEELGRLDLPLSESPKDPGEILKLLHEVGLKTTVTSPGGRYFGFVMGATLPQTVASSWLTSTWDQNAALFDTSPLAAYTEEISLRWLSELFGLPKTCGGAFVTGATMAGFTALAAARSYLLRRHGWDVEKKGLYGAPELRVIVSEEVHVMNLKAISQLGLGIERLTKIATDDQGRMLADKIPEIDGPTILCLQAGDVNSGCFDPFDEIIDKVSSDDVWVHVDGAFGMWVLVSEKFKHLAHGIEKADSWSIDAHKWLNVPYDNGIALIKNGDVLRSAMSFGASYLTPAPGQRRPTDYSPGLSSRARGIDIWMALATLGKSGIAEIVERCCSNAEYAANELSKAGFEILNDVVLNQVLVSFGDDARTDEVIKKIQQDGTCWCGGTTWKGRRAMRISVSSWATTKEDMRLSVEAMIACAKLVS
ncbi:MAG: pyridoxal-dependent decarboxylase [candidate division Zixibacteria bacterium]